MYFCVNEFEVGVNDSVFSGNEQQKVYYYCNSHNTQLRIIILIFIYCDKRISNV